MFLLYDAEWDLELGGTLEQNTTITGGQIVGDAEETPEAVVDEHQIPHPRCPNDQRRFQCPLT